MVLKYMLGIPGPSGFGSKSTCYEVAKAFKDDIKGKVVMITGSSSGIGVHCATALAMYGATVIMACRNKTAMHNVAENIREKVPACTIYELVCDLGSLSSVRKCAADFDALNLPLNVLINNAGIMFCPFMLSEDGYEMQFATNHLGHFLLTNLLAKRLKEGSPSRVVCVSSIAHQFAPPSGVLFDHLKNEEKYSKLAYYGQSKLCNMLHAHELNKRLSDKGVTAISLHPGSINTNLGRHSSLARLFYFLAYFANKSEVQGAANNIYCAFAKPGVGFEFGGYHDDCNIGVINHAAYNSELAKKLWDYSVEATGSDI